MFTRPCHKLMKLEDGRNIPVSGWLNSYSQGGQEYFSFSYCESHDQNTVILTDHHFSKSKKLQGGDWVPVSTHIPMNGIKPRPGFEKDTIETLEEYAQIFWRGKIIMGSTEFDEKTKCEETVECELKLEEALRGEDLDHKTELADEG